MFLSSLLTVSDDVTNSVAIFSTVACVLLFDVILLLCLKGKKQGGRYATKHVAFAGVALAASFVLSFVKVSPVLYGGSITLASFVPVLIYAYVFGVLEGLLVGLVFGLLNFISSPYILTPMTFVLDYLLAFASIALMGFFGKGKLSQKSLPLSFTLGCIAVYSTRFLFHFWSGVLYFVEGAIWVQFPSWAVSSAFVYSFIYQCVYIPADCLISCIAGALLSKTGVLPRLQKMIEK